MVPILKTVDLEDSEFVFDSLSFRNNRFGRFGRLAEPSAAKVEGLADFGEIFLSNLRNSENELNMLSVAKVIGKFTLCCQALGS